jgi:hypothetical protein
MAEVHPHIVATGGRPDSVTHFICPVTDGGETHHLQPNYHSVRKGDVAGVQTCVWCGKTEKVLREELGL